MREAIHGLSDELPPPKHEAGLTDSEWSELYGLLYRAAQSCDPHRKQTFSDAAFAAVMQRQDNRAHAKLQMALADELDLEADEEAAWSVRVPSRGGAAVRDEAGTETVFRCDPDETCGDTDDDWNGVYPGMCINPETCRGKTHCPRDYSCCE